MNLHTYISNLEKQYDNDLTTAKSLPSNYVCITRIP